MRTMIFFMLLCLAARPVSAQSKFRTGNVEIDGDLNQININANANFGKFRAELSTAYNIAENKIDHFHSELKMEPAEIYYTLEVSRVCNRPVDDVIEVYKTKRGKGWGKIAKELGIKPGSAEFHELKNRVSVRSGNHDRDDNYNEGEGGNGNGHGKEKKNHGNGNGNGHGNGRNK